MNAFMLLTWREWRRDRPIFLGVLAIAPVIALLVVAQRMPYDSTATILMHFVEITSFTQWGTGVLLAPLLAAHAVAGERADRSARFVASLPVSRTCRLSAKFAMLLALVPSLWVPYFLWLAFQPPNAGDLRFGGLVFTYTLMTTAIAWLLAAWLDSAILAGAVAIVVPIAVPLLHSIFAESIGLRGEDRRGVWIWIWIGPQGLPSLLTLLVAAGLFAAGTAIYLRRAE